MMYGYMGEEIVWKLLANNPYEPNNANGVTIRFVIDNYDDYQQITQTLLKHLPKERIVEIVQKQTPKKWIKQFGMDSSCIYSIDVKNVFGNISSVIISNIEYTEN